MLKAIYQWSGIWLCIFLFK